MGDRESRSRYRSSWLVLAIISAALLPLVSFVALQSAFAARSESRAVSAAATTKVETIVSLVDQRMLSIADAASTLARSPAVTGHDWQSAYAQSRTYAAQDPNWDSVVVWDRRRGIEYFDTRRPFGPPRPIAGPPGGEPPRGAVSISPVSAGPPPCPCIYEHVADGDLVISVRIEPRIFQDIVTRSRTAGGVISLLDPAGTVIARTTAWKDRFGKPASLPALRAIASGREGIYRGRTLEGFENYTAFATSPTSGWSAHYAFTPPRIFELSRLKWVGATVIAGLASLAVAGVLVLMALRNLKAQRIIGDQDAAGVRAEAAAQMVVARDLHDGILQFLTGLSLRLDAFSHRLTDDNPSPATREIGEGLTGLRQDIRTEQRELRSFIERLHPEAAPPPQARSIVDVAHNLARRWDIEVAIAPPTADTLIPPPLRRDVEFIVREATSNAVRHGGAKSIDIAFRRDQQVLVMTIDDDGQGFPTSGRFSGDALAALPTKPATILGRVNDRLGRFELASSPAGASLHISFPV